MTAELHRNDLLGSSLFAGELRELRISEYAALLDNERLSHGH
jgi:hypothetical protein